jgi:hypothetical protein
MAVIGEPSFVIILTYDGLTKQVPVLFTAHAALLKTLSQGRLEAS